MLYKELFHPLSWLTSISSCIQTNTSLFTFVTDWASGLFLDLRDYRTTMIIDVHISFLNSDLCVFFGQEWIFFIICGDLFLIF